MSFVKAAPCGISVDELRDDRLASGLNVSVITFNAVVGEHGTALKEVIKGDLVFMTFKMLLLKSKILYTATGKLQKTSLR